MPNDEIEIGGIKYKIPNMALTLMVAALLIPAAQYAIRLDDPTPAQLLVAICISLFSSVVCLWVLDAVSILRFRSEWVSRSIYGAAIASVLGTSVGVYQGAFAERKFPYEGAWILRVHSVADDTFVADHTVVLIHSDSTGTYWGYSETSLDDTEENKKAIAAEVVEFAPESGDIAVRLLLFDGNEIAVEQQLSSEKKEKRYVTKTNETTEKYKITLTRPR